MPWQAHKEFHEVTGTYWVSGLGLTAGTYVVYAASTAPTLVADNTPGVDVGVVKDEDLETTVPALTQGTYTTAYRSGAAGDWVFDTTATLPYFVGTNTLQYNQYTGATWKLTNATEDAYVNVFDFAIPVTSDADSQKYRHVWITGQTLHTTLAAAQAEQPGALSLGTLQNLFAEATCVNRLTYQFNATGTGSVGAGVSGRCKIMSADPIRGTARNQVAIIGSTPTLSNAASIGTSTTNFDKNLSTADITVQLALDTLDEFNALPSNATNASASPDLTNKAAFASATDGQAATFTFDARGVIEFQVDVGTDGGMVIACDYKSTVINALSDPSGLFLATDAGTGIVITKSANSAVVTVKNRMGAPETIGILAIRSPITAATAWA
jgi:hypothetical protein